MELVLRTLGELLEETDRTSELVSRNSAVSGDNARLTLALLQKVLELERRAQALERGRPN